MTILFLKLVYAIKFVLELDPAYKNIYLLVEKLLKKNTSYFKLYS